MVQNAGNVGKVTQIIGSVLDVEFEEHKLPSLHNALKVEVDRPQSPAMILAKKSPNSYSARGRLPGVCSRPQSQADDV